MSTDDEVRLCIVGAGLAAAGVADALREESVSVTVLEKSRGVGGRAATRRRNGCRYDHGANYIKDSDERTRELLQSLGTEGFADIDAPVWPFDSDGTISESERPEAHKWTWAEGITQLAKRLFGRTDAEIRKDTLVDALRHSSTGWTVTDTDGSTHGPFDAVVMTPPAPQTADLLRATEIHGADNDLSAAIDAVDRVPYRTIRAVMLHYPFEIDRPYYALVNDDREHDIGWLARESCKPGHIPDGEELLVVQMAPDWSTATYDSPLDEIVDDVADMAAQLLDEDRLRDPDWVDDQGWRYALPDAAVDSEAVAPLESYGLYVAGDWVVGEGRAHEALWNGVALGERIAGEL
ncbi:NAD/FAD-dependent oxidoreductase [Halonotius terrestris]|uniref:NAD/FAD-dependent oxidoreductase n=1 Tax=Halonotius terrestris TaxID=2487750 RepID=A0A8J8PA30_9EURY|nr:FAD-dependent oxidoreductase [Halonotius terrestris]TQQ83009.1 NAD/FAD-dependent oxidoreductase [Halonotius terrestris]